MPFFKKIRLEIIWKAEKLNPELISFCHFLDLNKLDGFGDSTKKDTEVSDYYQLEIYTKIAFKMWLYDYLSCFTVHGSNGSGTAKALL